MGFYGVGMALDIRRDIVARFIKLIIEIGKYGADGIKINIKNGWFRAATPKAIISLYLRKPLRIVSSASFSENPMDISLINCSDSILPIAAS